MSSLALHLNKKEFFTEHQGKGRNRSVKVYGLPNIDYILYAVICTTTHTHTHNILLSFRYFTLNGDINFSARPSKFPKLLDTWLSFDRLETYFSQKLLGDVISVRY